MTATGTGAPSARDVQNSKTLDVGMRVGLASYGGVHLLFAFIALKLAFQGSSESSKGALQDMAQDTFGQILLWVAAVGLLLLALWQGMQAAVGYGWRSDGRGRKRIESGFRTVVYLAVAWLAISTAAGLGGGGSEEQSLTSDLMKLTFGRWLVLALGLAVIAVGVGKIVKGVKKKFTEDLAPQATTGQSGRTLVRLGQAGYVAKGFALGAVGGLFCWAALTFDSQKAGGLDAALRTLLDQRPLGQIVVGLTGLGLAAFGVYCFGWARHPRT